MKRYKVFTNGGDDSMTKVQNKIEDILNDPDNSNYELDKLEMVVCGSTWPYKFVMVMKYTGGKPKNKSI